MSWALTADRMGDGAAPARHPVAAGIVGLARGIAVVAHGAAIVARTLRRSGERLDDWLAARAKARADSVALLAMSERELRDIGIDPARIGVEAREWRRDRGV